MGVVGTAAGLSSEMWFNVKAWICVVHCDGCKPHGATEHLKCAHFKTEKMDCKFCLFFN